jgi:hypothetical protein
MSDRWTVFSLVVVPATAFFLPVAIGFGFAEPSVYVFIGTMSVGLSALPLAMMIFVEVASLFTPQIPEELPNYVEGRVMGLGRHVEFPSLNYKSSSCVAAVPASPRERSRAVSFALQTADETFFIDVDSTPRRPLVRRDSVRPATGMQWLRPFLGLARTPPHPGDVAGWMCVHEGDIVVIWTGLRVRANAQPGTPGPEASSGWSTYRSRDAVWHEMVPAEIVGDEGPATVPIGVGTARDQLVDGCLRLSTTWWAIRWWLPISSVLLAPGLLGLWRASWLASPILPITGLIAISGLSWLVCRRVFREIKERIAEIQAKVAAPALPELEPLVGWSENTAKPPRQASMAEVLVANVLGGGGRRVLGIGALLAAVYWAVAHATDVYGFVAGAGLLLGVGLVLFIYLVVSPLSPTEDFRARARAATLPFEQQPDVRRANSPTAGAADETTSLGPSAQDPPRAIASNSHGPRALS